MFFVANVWSFVEHVHLKADAVWKIGKINDWETAKLDEKTKPLIFM
jgi:hypothetical protein